MITYYKGAGSPEYDPIQEALENLCIAHEMIRVSQGTRLPKAIPEGVRPPVLVDGKEIIQGMSPILNHIDKLIEIKALWDKYQTDTCYCDEHGNVE